VRKASPTSSRCLLAIAFPLQKPRRWNVHSSNEMLKRLFIIAVMRSPVNVYKAESLVRMVNFNTWSTNDTIKKDRWADNREGLANPAICWLHQLGYDNRSMPFRLSLGRSCC